MYEVASNKTEWPAIFLPSFFLGVPIALCTVLFFQGIIKSSKPIIPLTPPPALTDFTLSFPIPPSPTEPPIPEELIPRPPLCVIIEPGGSMFRAMMDLGDPDELSDVPTVDTFDHKGNFIQTVTTANWPTMMDAQKDPLGLVQPGARACVHQESIPQTPTPTGLKGPGRYASAPKGFHIGKASKAAFTGGRIRF